MDHLMLLCRCLHNDVQIMQLQLFNSHKSLICSHLSSQFIIGMAHVVKLCNTEIGGIDIRLSQG